MVWAGTPTFTPFGTISIRRIWGPPPPPDGQTGDSAALAAAFQGMDQCRQDSSAGGPDGMAQRTGPAVDVHPRLVQFQVLDGGHRDHGEGLVHLVQVDVRRS